MSETISSAGSPATLSEARRDDQRLFWGCFLALVTTAFGFIARMFLINTWAQEFGLDGPQAGRLAGIGIWPFAVSIIGFSLVIDRIGYKVSMVLAFAGHMVWVLMGVSAYFVAKANQPQAAYALLYWGSLVLGLANGTVEAFINPVVATMFSRDKTKWLNILHAGWPGGLVAAGMLVIFLGQAEWWLKVGLLALPAILYFILLIPLRFPVQERVASGVTYREMLSEFGILGALVVGCLVALQLMDFFSAGASLTAGQKAFFIAIGAGIVAASGFYARALGRPLMFVLVLIMMPLATTEIGTDGWITSIMEGVAQARFHPGWILVYTSLIMMVLRFCAGFIVHALSPLGLLAVSSALAIAGLFLLSQAAGVTILVAATLYGFGKTFFWPTMLGVVSEQTPKGGALTLNAISGIGMLAVGTLGFPYIGALKEAKQIEAIAASPECQQAPALVSGGQLMATENRSIYEIIHYKAISDQAVGKALASLSEDERARMLKTVTRLRETSNQRALANMTVFPILMLAGYLILLAYFRSRGGYRPVVLGS
ncbi:MAG: MFS transporter [Planctomycetes bacterium]|nr:MFS transporter [Planctomycetota bacterium]